MSGLGNNLRKNAVIYIIVSGVTAVLLVAGLFFALNHSKGTGEDKANGEDGDKSIFPALHILSDEPEKETDDGNSESPADAQPEAVTGDEGQAAEVQETEYGLDPETGYIFIGDSRFVGMDDACGISSLPNCFVVAKVGEGYGWLKSTALGQVDRIVETGLFDEWVLVTGLGVNDPARGKDYVSEYEKLAEKYICVLVSVNPVNEELTSTKNATIEQLNDLFKEMQLPYVDVYGILMSDGYSTMDGLHYTGDTYRYIWSCICSGIGEIFGVEASMEADEEFQSKQNDLKASIQKQIKAENKRVEQSKLLSGNSVASYPPAVADTAQDGGNVNGAGGSEDSDRSEDPGGSANAGEQVPGKPDAPAPTDGDKIYISGQWMTEAELIDYGLTPEQVQNIRETGHP